jgi:hypothetical protein
MPPVSQLFRHLRQKPRGLLYHYTSMEALHKIIDHGRVWATDIYYLNDSSEYTNAKEFVKTLLSRRLVGDTSLRAKSCPRLSSFK